MSGRLIFQLDTGAPAALAKAGIIDGAEGGDRGMMSGSKQMLSAGKEKDPGRI